MPYFSVLIPAYNRARYLPECLNSVRTQTFADWECIVVDDGSTDGTRELVEEYGRRDARFRYHWQENAGVSAARNAGIALAAGEWVAFLDSDDYYLPTALEALRRAAQTAPEADVVCGFLADEPPPAGREEGSVAAQDAFFAIMGFQRGRPPLYMQSTAVRRSRIAEIGGFACAYKTAEDWEFVMRAAARFQIATVYSVVAHYRVDHGEGKSDVYMASGQKIETHRRIFHDIAQHPVVQERLRSDPKACIFQRLHRAYCWMLESAELVRSGQTAPAARRLQEAMEQCETAEERRALLLRFRYYLYYPVSRPWEAAPRCAAWMSAMADSLAGEDSGPLRDTLRQTAADAYFLAAASLRRSGKRSQAWRTAFAGLWRIPSLRTAKALLRFLLGAGQG